MRIGERSELHTVRIDQFGVGLVEPRVFQRLAVQERPGIRRGQRYLDRMRIDLGGETNRLLDRFLGLAGKAENEGPVDRDPELAAILGKAAGDVDPHPLFDVVEDLLVARLVADQQQP